METEIRPKLQEDYSNEEKDVLNERDSDNNFQKIYDKRVKSLHQINKNNSKSFENLYIDNSINKTKQTTSLYSNGSSTQINNKNTISQDYSSSIVLFETKNKSIEQSIVNKPKLPTKETLNQYRINAKKSMDPEVQLDFSKYLIETASLILQDSEIDPESSRNLHSELITEALKWIKKLANQGVGIGRGAYSEAQFFLANLYNNGSLGLNVDHDKAFNLYVQASKQNHSSATYRTGVCYELGAGTKKDYNRAVQFFRKSACLGDTAAMFKMGMITLKGLLNQNINEKEAITWLKRAASNSDEENPHALHELASIYERGDIASVIKDTAYSRELYTKAANLGYSHSMYKLGVIYEQGILETMKNPKKSIYWFSKGAEKNDPECELALSGWYLTGAENILNQSDNEAYLWARKAADKGLPKAEYAVGYYTEVGIGVKQDLQEASKFYMRAAAQGNKRAMNRLTEIKKLSKTSNNNNNLKKGSCLIS